VAVDGAAAVVLCLIAARATDLMSATAILGSVWFFRNPEELKLSESGFTGLYDLQDVSRIYILLIP
jgi:hypothetical protein